MMRRLTLSIVWLGFIVSLSAVARAQGDIAYDEIEALKQRIRELEAQNRAILREVAALKAELAGRSARVADARSESAENDAAEGAGGFKPADAKPGPASSRSRQQDDAVRWRELVVGDSQLQFYGFLRLDVITDSARPDFFQTPFFILSRDPSLGPGNEESNFTLHPRLTRIGMNFSGPAVEDLGGGRLSGKFEVDFQNGGRESRPRFRTRHAYMKMSWGGVSLLGGQTWDIISPLYPTVNNDTLMWNAGNLGDRRAQIRFTYEPDVGQGTFSFVGGIGLTGAVSPQDLDADGVRDGEASSRPNLQSRIGYRRTLWSEESTLSFGVSGHYAWEDTVAPIAGRDDFRSQSLNFDYDLSLHDRVAIEGEAWFGRNLSDFRGGVGQAINAALGTEIRSRGGWGELALKLSRFYTIHPGYAIDDPVDRDVPTLGRVKNRAWYIVNRFRPGGPFLVGIDYLRWTTDYKDLERGVDNRVNLYLQYNF